jgi:hypothetical protein
MRIELKLTKEEADLLSLVLIIVDQRYETFVTPSKNKKELVLRKKLISEHKLILNSVWEKLSVIKD